MRKEILEFAEKMEEKMQKHDAEKGDSWKVLHPSFLEVELDRVIREYRNTEKPDKLISIANFCMMLYRREEARLNEIE